MLTDIRHAYRALRTNPGFTSVALITLALGIGANTAIFSVVRAVLLRPLPFARESQVIKVWPSTGDELRNNHSAGEFLDLQRDNQSLASIAGYRNGLFSVAASAGPSIQLPGAFVTAEFFDVLQPPTLAGRTFSAADRGSRMRAVVLGHGAWQELFGGADAVGRSLRINGEAHTVVAVLRPHAAWPLAAKLWVLSERRVPPSPIETSAGEADRDVRYFEAVARMKPELTIDRVRADLVRVSGSLAGQHRSATPPSRFEAGLLRDEIVGDVRNALVMLQAAVAVVLLIACANVSGLLIARATGRQREIAIRAALGAGRARLIRHLVAESLVLGVAGGASGLLLGAWLVRLLVRVLPDGLPRAGEISLDGAVAALTMGAAMVSSLLFGVVPALQASRANATTALKSAGERGSSGRAPARSALVVAELALTVVLLVVAGLLVKSFVRLQRTDSGFDSASVTLTSVALPPARYPTAASQVAVYRRLVDSLEGRPEVQAVGVGFPGPLRGSNASGHFFIENRPSAREAAQPFAHLGSVSGGYFRAMGIPLLAGRTFADTDTAGAPGVAIVSTALAKRYWPGENAVGKRLRFDNDPQADWITVVGIVGDVRQLGLDRDAPPLMFIPYPQFPLPFTNLALRSRTGDAAAAALVRAQLAAIDPDLPAGEVASLATLIGRSIAEPRFRSYLIGAFAATALALAAVGVFGLVSYGVAQRRREFGIRIALGAQPRHVLGPVLREGLRLAGLGLAIGMAGSLIASQLVARFLFGVRATDVTTFGGVCGLLLAVALIATYIPSRRALTVDAAQALQGE